MQRLKLRIGDHVRTGEAFHLRRDQLERGKPRVMHTHDFFECFWIEEGAGYHFINGARTDLRPGQVVFIRPADTHEFQKLGDSECRLTNVAFFMETAMHLANRYPNELANRFFWTDSLMPYTQQIDDSQLGDFKRLVRDLDNGPRNLARIEGFLIEVTTGLFRDLGGIADHAPPWLVRACRLAREREVFHDGAAGFVRVSGRAHEHVCRTTRQILGISPSTFINRIRMEYAARRIAGSDEQIADIALDCGLENLSYFYRLFRQEWGMTPRAYRRYHQKSLVQP